MADNEITRETMGTYKPQDTYDEWHRDSIKPKVNMRMTYRVTRDMCYSCGIVNPEEGVVRKGTRSYCKKCA